MSDPRKSEPMRMVVVCTANVSRSPAAERLLRYGLDESVEVTSAGTMRLVGAPMDPMTVKFLTDRGVDADGFASSPISEPSLMSTDLVLTLTRDHRSILLELVPSILRRTFTLLEFANLATKLDLTDVPENLSMGDRLREIAPLAADQRSVLGMRGAAIDVPDPFGRSGAEYREAFSAIAWATDTIIAVARGRV